MSEAAAPGGMRSRLGAAGLLSDDRLARRAVKGDERAFAAIFDRYHQDLYRYCTAILGNPTDAQDALQNTMVKVLRALPGEERQVELRPWLYRIAHNEAVELLRRRRPTEELDPEQLARGGGLAEDVEARERLRRLVSDLDQLPDRQRGALVMRELAGLGFAEIAASLDTSEGVARQTVYEARLSLRQMDEGREMSCDAVTRTLSDADGRVARRRDIRAHLRACPDCRRFREELAGRRHDLAGLAPLPAVAAAGLLQGLLGGAGGSAASGAGLAGALGGGAAKSLGATAAIKAAATVAVVAAVGVGAADRSGVVDVTPWGGGSQQTESERGAGGAGARSQGGASQQAPGSGAAKGGPGSAAVENAAAADAAGVGTTGEKSRGGLGTSSDAAAAAPAAAGGAAGAATHPRGRGHEKQHPAASAHGQQTAASHKATGNGANGARGGAGEGQPAKATKPKKPEKPAKPPRQPSQAAGEGGGQAAAPPKAPANPRSAATPPTASAPPAEQEAPAPPPAAGK